MSEVNYELMSDGMSQEEVEAYNQSVYSPRDLEMMGKFENIHNQISCVEEATTHDSTIGWFTHVEEGKANKKDLVFLMDVNLLRTMHYIALNMYEEAMGDPKMKEAYDQMLQARRQAKEDRRQFEVSELDVWWNQS